MIPNVAQVVPAEGVVGLGLGATILIVLLPILLRAYARAQAGVWDLVAAKEDEITTLKAEAVDKDRQIELWRDRAYAAGWRAPP